MNKPTYTMTSEAITVVLDGKTHVVRKSAPQFKALQTVLKNREWDKIPDHITVVKSIQSWAKDQFGYENNQFIYGGRPLPTELNDRIVKMATRGDDPTPFFRFWERLQRNPSKRSVDQLWAFLSQQGIPLEKDGTFLAYKGVRTDLTDQHTGTFDNSPGNVHEMPRNQISDDPNHACHEGFHVGSLNYAKGFGSRVMICRVDPEHVVCIPYDHSCQKMRICKYEVVGHSTGDILPSTVYTELDPDSDSVEDINPSEEDQVAITPQTQTEVVKRRSKRGFAKFDKMDMRALYQQTLDDLRRYANKGLQIVGAYHIPGGKAALISKILEIRQ